MARANLRAVQGDESLPEQVQSVTQAATSGSQRDLLVALRDRIARDVESLNTASRDLSSLTRRLMEINKEIIEIDARDEGESDGETAVDEPWDAEAI